LDRVVDRIVELDEGKLIEYPGDYSYYREEKQKRVLET
jgi:macrolide transport system ATP-binding/permease protein